MSFDSDAWQNATLGEREDKQPPPPGTYDVSVQSARAFTSSKGNDVMIVGFRVVAGPLEGHVWDDVRGASGRSTSAAKAMAESLGVAKDAAPASLEELDDLLDVAVGNYFEVEVKQNGDFTNTYVNRQIRAVDPSASDVPSDFPVGPVSGDPVPTPDGIEW